MNEKSPDIPRVFRPQRALPTDVVRPTRAIVDLANLRHNLHVLRQAAEGQAIWAVVKADGYGHGSKAVGRTLERAGVDGLCVALVEEGVELREAGIQLPILVMGGYYGDAYSELVHHQLTVVLQDRGQIEALANAVRRRSAQPIAAHLKVDTGMARLGERQAHWPTFARALRDAPEVRFAGLMTHFPNADLPYPDAIAPELAHFEKATQVFRNEGLVPEVRHASNSAAIFRGTKFDLVRPGIALFGVSPFHDPSPAPLNERAQGLLSRLRPVMSLSSRIVALREIEPGDAVGYGSTWRAPRRARIATVPMGYADGLSRALSNKGAMLVRGRRAPIVGIISMDMTAVDVTDIPQVTMSDDVVLLGSSDDDAGNNAILTAWEVAQNSGTIAWEVLTNISRRVPRFYIGA